MLQKHQDRVQRWQKLVNAYNGLGHVPKIKREVDRAYSKYSQLGLSLPDALEKALIDHAFYKDERTRVMADGAMEYEEIMEGDRIWADIQRTSGN